MQDYPLLKSFRNDIYPLRKMFRNDIYPQSVQLVLTYEHVPRQKDTLRNVTKTLFNIIVKGRGITPT